MLDAGLHLLRRKPIEQPQRHSQGVDVPAEDGVQVSELTRPHGLSRVPTQPGHVKHAGRGAGDELSCM